MSPGTADPSARSESTTPAQKRADHEIDAARLARFFGSLAVLAAGFVAVGRVAEVRLVALAPPYMFTPAIAAGVTVLTTDASRRDVGARIGRLRWHLAAVVTALALVGVALVVAVAVPEVTFDASADPTPGLALPTGALGVVALAGIAVGAGVTVNALFALGEELGWRGYLLWELAPLGFWRASGLVGLAWGLWHAPIILDGYNYPSFPLVGVVVMTAATVAFSPVYTFVVVRARSVLAAGFFHGVFNAAAGVLLAYAVTADPVRRELVASPVGAAGIGAFVLAAVVIGIGGTPTLDRATIWGGAEPANGPESGSERQKEE